MRLQAKALIEFALQDNRKIGIGKTRISSTSWFGLKTHGKQSIP
jgi:hypothetical protein